MLDEYLEQLVEEGSLDSHGRITLDVVKARQKLAESRFAHAAEALLAVIGAAILARSQSIQVAHHSLCWELCSDGAPPGPEQLKELMQNLFDPRQPSMLRELGLAFNSLYPKHCVSLSAEVEDGWVGEFANGDWRVTQKPPTLQPPYRLKVTLTQDPAWRHPWKWIRQVWTGVDEMKILRARTRWSPVPVLFQQGNQWRSSYELAPPRVPAGALAEIEISSRVPELQLPPYSHSDPMFRYQRSGRARSSLRCLLLPGEPANSQLLLVYRGLSLALHHLNGQLFRFEGVLNTDSLDLDASRQHIVQNQRLRQRRETVRQWVLEGAVAWLRQLDPENLSLAQRQMLTEALPRLNKSSILRPLLEALGGFPLIQLADGQSFASLDEVRLSLEEFEAIHVAEPGSPARLHDRPLISSQCASLASLRRLFRAEIVVADRWVQHARKQGGPLSTSLPRDSVYESFQLSGPQWEATVAIPIDFRAPQRLVMKRKGIPFHATNQPLFELFPCCFQILLDGDYGGSLDKAEHNLVMQLRQAMAEAVPLWLERMRSYAHQGLLSKLYDQAYCSLLCLWMTWETSQPRQPPPEWLDYPVVITAPEGDRHSNLASLLGSQLDLKSFLPKGHPAITLSGLIGNRRR